MMALLAGLITWAMSGAIARLLIGGGITLVVAAGIETMVSSFMDQAVSAMGGAPGAILQLSLLFGWGEAMSIMGGALLTRVAIMTLANVLGVSVAK